MDSERQKKRQSLKVIISEAIMTLTVIVTVIVLAFVVSGYWLNSDFEIERQGMLQVYSAPTGADVSIDGDVSWFQKTNTSKVLSSGEHSVTLTKEGYDSWSKNINISEGLLYRLHYPRLFLTERTKESVLDTAKVVFATISPSRDTMLLIEDSGKWFKVNLDDTTLSKKEVVIPESFLKEQAKENYSVSVLSSEWSRDNSKILFNLNSDGENEWVIIDINNPEKDVNLTKIFNADFETVKILDNSASNLLATVNSNLHKIDVGNKSISAIIAEKVQSYDYHDNTIIFSAQSKESEYYVGATKTNDDKVTMIMENSEPVKIENMRFYDDDYIVILAGKFLHLYQKDTYEMDSEYELSFVPTDIKVGYHGDYIVMYSQNRIAALDMEAKKITEWSTDGESFGWIDTNMIYSVSDKNLYVYDFDGLNRRMISEGASDKFPATITSDKWLYYFSNNHLIRETIAK